MMQDNFFGKIYLNILASLETGVIDGMVLSEFYGEAHGLGDQWRSIYRKKQQKFMRGVSKSEGGPGFINCMKFINKADINQMIQTAKREVPNLEEDYYLSSQTRLFSGLLELSRTETLMLELAIRINGNLRWGDNTCLANMRYANEDSVKLYAKIFAIDDTTARAALNGFLVQSNFLVSSETPKGYFEINEEFSELFSRPNLTLDNIEQYLFPSNLASELTIDNYIHLEKPIGIAETIINRGITDRTRGSNILLWGMAGTGKTELGVVLAKKNGWNLKVIGDIDDGNNDEKSRTQRLTSLKVAMKLFHKRDNVVLLFDEMEDLFKNDNEDFSKAFINRIIETTKIPIIWTTNELEMLGAPVLRRMIYNIHFTVPPVKARRQIWDTYARKYDLTLDEELLDHLATNFDVVPALVSNAAKIAHLTRLDSGDIEEVLTRLDTLVHYGRQRQFAPRVAHTTPYDLSFINADADMERLTARLLGAKSHAFNICLYGAPGTGKSQYGRHIAERLGKRVLFKRASDLVSPWVGVTERNIADAFRQAKDGEQVLIIDEADTFLRSRSKAIRSWEVSEVNEMLSQMEIHTQPFICTTNLMDDVDEAALRRFTFKIKFDFLKPVQARGIFEAYFGVAPPDQILRNFVLAPGDFATVKRKADILGEEDPKALYEMLEQECAMKPQFSRAIGF